MIHSMPTNGVIDELQRSVKAALKEQNEEIEKRLAAYGLTLGDVPSRLLREQRGNITRYLIDGKPIFETEMFITAQSIRFEIRPL